MHTKADLHLDSCLYFATNSLARTMNKLAEEEFMRIGLSPSYAFLQLLVNEHPGISQCELSASLNLAPSTVTRFLDKLVSRNLLRRECQGKHSNIYPTDAGLALDAKIRAAWSNLYERCCHVLGKEFTTKLATDIHQANQFFGKQT